MYENYLGKELAQSFYDAAFKQAGWDGAWIWIGPGSGFGYGVTVGQGSETAPRIKAAIEAASHVKVDVSPARTTRMVRIDFSGCWHQFEIELRTAQSVHCSTRNPKAVI